MPQIQENILLSDHSTFKIGGPARYFCAAKGSWEIEEALDFAIEKKLRVFIIGRGSNLLIADKGFDGLVLRIENRDMELIETAAGIEARLGAGIPLNKLILDLGNENVAGLEWAAGIPATLGGAIANNAGAKGMDMGQAVKSVKVLEMRFFPEGCLASYTPKELLREACGFSYRKSIFKESKGFVILDAALLLQKGDSEEIRKEIGANLESRREKQPLEYPNVGSIFKNPTLSREQQERLAGKCPNFLQVVKNDSVPAGWLIEKAGLKGKKVGGVMISEKHANFIINTGEGKAEEVIILISLIKEKVRVMFGVQLHEEIEYVGF